MNYLPALVNSGVASLIRTQQVYMLQYSDWGFSDRHHISDNFLASQKKKDPY